jgi:hypothetical protein
VGEQTLVAIYVYASLRREGALRLMITVIEAMPLETPRGGLAVVRIGLTYYNELSHMRSVTGLSW